MADFDDDVPDPLYSSPEWHRPQKSEEHSVGFLGAVNEVCGEFLKSFQAWDPDTHLETSLDRNEVTVIINSETISQLFIFGIDLKNRFNQALAQKYQHWNTPSKPVTLRVKCKNRTLLNLH